MPSKRIAILGAGSSGLTSIKACVEEGLQPVCFELTDNIAGLWHYRPYDIDGVASVSKSTIINTSKEISAFSDFPPPKDLPNFMRNEQMCGYFESYAEKFDLKKYIKFNHRVKWVTPNDDFESTGRWSVTVVHQDPVTQNETEHKDIFDGVMVCTGHHVIPHIPDFEGKDEFKGEFIHTHSFKTSDPLKDKNVMVIGTGNSGMDATIDSTAVAKQTYISTRRGFWVLRRVEAKGWPFDLSLINRFKSSFLHPFILNFVMEKQANAFFDHNRYGIKASHAFLSQHPSICDNLPNRIISGQVIVKGAIERFVPEGVIFRGEKEVTPLDVVILATGYEYGYSFIDPKVAKINNDEIELYKWVFPPNLKHNTIAYIGIIQPIGPLFPISELQARWYAQVMKGNVTLPSKEDMLKDIDMKLAFNRKHFISGIRHVVEVAYIPYCDELASQFGAMPNLKWMALTDPYLCASLFLAPTFSYMYRLVGPNTWKGARDAILSYKGRVEAAFQTNTSQRNTPSLWERLSWWW